MSNSDEQALNREAQSPQCSANLDNSVVSRALNANSKGFEILLQSYNLADGSRGASSTDFWEMGTWDEGHWCNRQK